MRPFYSVAVQPFLTVASANGHTTAVSLADAFEQATNLNLADPSPLARAATLRFLLAIAYHTGLAPTTIDEYHHNIQNCHAINWQHTAAWLRDNPDLFDLFHPTQPLWQDAALQAIADNPKAPITSLYLDFTAAHNRPLHSDHHGYIHSLTMHSPPELARLMLMQNTWAVGGRISASAALYGTGANYGYAAAHTGSFLWMPQHPTLAQDLAWRMHPTEHTGTPHWTYTHRGQPTKQGLTPTGEADALHWLSRRMLALPNSDGTTSHILFAQGWNRALDPAAKPGPPTIDPTQPGLCLLYTSDAADE